MILLWLNMRNNNKGIALILVILLLMIVPVAVLGMALFVSQGTRLSVLRANSNSAIFLAQAGINKAIVDSKTGPYAIPVAFTQLGTNLFYRYGREISLLSVNASQCYFISYTVLKNIPLRNVSTANSIRVEKMIVEWDTTSGAHLTNIYLGGVKRIGPISADSGQLLNLNVLFVLLAGASYNGVEDNRWEFDRPVQLTANKYNTPLSVTFIMADNSRRKAVMISKDFLTGNNEFSITATGRVGDQGSGSAARKRTIEATYDMGKNVITSWQETALHLPD